MTQQRGPSAAGPRRLVRAISHDRRVVVMAAASGLPAVVVALALLWGGSFTPKVQWTLTVLILTCWGLLLLSVRRRVVFPLQTLSNLLAGLREGDSSIRARGADADDPLGEVMLEANALAQTLRDQRLGAIEATSLLEKVMTEIDVAIFAFDHDEALRLVNRAGTRLLGVPAERLVTRRATDLGLGACLTAAPPRILDLAFPGGQGRYELRRTTFRRGGLPLTLLVLADVSRPLRDEERQAWQRLMRVLGHEINNSLAPIKSIAGSLDHLLSRVPPPPDWHEDAHRGLGIIASRAEALSRFTEAYSKLARLPQPTLHPVRVDDLVRRAVVLETRRAVDVTPGPDATIRGDGGQLEQVLINLVRNAVDASADTNGRVTVGWAVTPAHVELWIDDEGPGLSNSANLFVPFFTTKPGGSGIGLVLSRQIAEAHGGHLSLANRADGAGCRATLRLPR